MTPAAFVVVEQLPLDGRGKIDRKTLSRSETWRGELDVGYAAPRHPEAEMLAGIWSEVLKVERVGLDDNYFSLGGDSIRSIQIVARAAERSLHFGVELLFEQPTIRELVSTLRGTGTKDEIGGGTEPFDLVSPEDRAKMPAGVEDAYPLSMLQGGMIFHRMAHPGSALYHDIFSLHLQARLDYDALHAVVRQLIGRHAALRTSFAINEFSQPLQLVHREAATPVELEDLRELAPAEQERIIREWIEAEKAEGFDIESAPLIRFRVHRRSRDSFQLSGRRDLSTPVP